MKALDAFIRRLAPVRALEIAPVWGVAAVLAGLSVAPFAFQDGPGFCSDDILVSVRGAETPPLEGLPRWFGTSFLDTRTMELYRPLFSWWFCLGASLFGADASPYFMANLIWFALAVFLGHLLLARWIGRGGAVVGTLFAVANPWAANNVCWLVGHVTVTTTVTVCAVALLHLRRVARRRAAWPWKEALVLLVGLFYRETAVFAIPLVFIIDVCEGRRDRLALRDALILTIPFVVFAVCCFAVMGEFPPAGYARFTEAMGGAVGEPTPLAQLITARAEVLLAVVVPFDGALLAPEYRSTERLAALVLFALVVVLGAFGRGWRSSALWGLGVFIALHAVVVLWADALLTGSNAQRWHTVVWAAGGFLGGLAVRSRYSGLAVVCLLALTVLNFMRLQDDLEDYDASARFMDSVVRAVNEAPEELVLLHGVPDFVGASPFLSVGAGMVTAPPFGDGSKRVFSISRNRRFAPDEQAQTPIAAHLRAKGERFTALWCDPGGLEVVPVPDALVAAAGAAFAAMPRLDVKLPKGASWNGADALPVRVASAGLERIDFHVVSPLAEVRFERRRGAVYSTGRHRGEGEKEFWLEHLDYALEQAAFRPGVPSRRCFLWIVGYEDGAGARLAGVSDVIEITLP